MFAIRRLATLSNRRLLSTLAVLEHRGGKISSVSLPALTAAAKLGGPVTAFVAGTDSSQVAVEAAKLAGVEKVLHVENGKYDKVCIYPNPLVTPIDPSDGG